MAIDYLGSVGIRSLLGIFEKPCYIGLLCRNYVYRYGLFVLFYQKWSHTLVPDNSIIGGVAFKSYYVPRTISEHSH